MKKKKRIKLNKFNVAVIIFMVLFVVACFADTSTYSRYAVQNKTETVAVPATYFFESNYLMSENLTTPTYTVYATDVTVTVKNNDGVNYTNETISYDITITTDDSESELTITDEYKEIIYSGGSEYDSSIENDDTSENLTYDSTIPKQNVSNTYVITADKGTTVTVTATSTVPYAETITANFYFDDANNESFYAFVDMGYYCVLQVYTGTEVIKDSELDSITVKYDIAKLAPNNMDPEMAIDNVEWFNGVGTITGLSPHSYYEYVFYKNNYKYLTYSIGQNILSDAGNIIDLTFSE